MERIVALAADKGLAIIEDCAQAIGARSRVGAAGTHGDLGAFSFYPTKNLGAVGDGGCVTTDDAALAARLRRLRNYGQEQKYIHQEAGVNSRLDELQAAFLRVQLARLDAGNAARAHLAQLYGEALAGCDELRTPVQAAWAAPVHHLYVVESARRDDLQAGLSARGLETLVHYPVACHQQPAFEHLGFQAGAFPVAERLAAEVLSLPLRPGMSAADVAIVAAAVRETMGADHA
jgi:dTDP-4-amino-4,6-dideoxygalactose transaminase